MIEAIERRNESAVALIRSLERPTIRSIFVNGELVAGVETATMRRLGKPAITIREITAIAYARLSTTPERWMGDEIASHFGWLTAHCSSKQLRVGQTDRWILAEALSHAAATVHTADTAMHTLGTSVTKTKKSVNGTHLAHLNVRYTARFDDCSAGGPTESTVAW